MRCLPAPKHKYFGLSDNLHTTWIYCTAATFSNLTRVSSTEQQTRKILLLNMHIANTNKELRRGEGITNSKRPKIRSAHIHSNRNSTSRRLAHRCDLLSAHHTLVCTHMMRTSGTRRKWFQLLRLSVCLVCLYCCLYALCNTHPTQRSANQSK